MSLHIGNLSSHTHLGELERVFRRFGRCSLRVKDKYGFVVYDYPASAEKALKTLRGTRICGEALTLSWSKHQPHAMQRFPPGGMPYKQPYRKFFAKENAGRRVGPNIRHDYENDFKKASEGRTVGSSDLVNESMNYHPDDAEGYVGERDPSYIENDHRFGNGDRSHLEDDRWGEQIVNPSHESYLENDIEFDRYEPCHSVGVQELDEHHPTPESPVSRNSKERTGNFYGAKSQKNCYLCGEVGHKMRNCPLELQRHAPRPRGRIGPGLEGDTVPMRYRENNGGLSGFRNHQRLLRHGDSSPPYNRKRDFRHKKRKWRDHESTDKDLSEKPGGPSSPSIHSGYKPSKKSTSIKSVSPSTSSGSLPLDLNRDLPSSPKKARPESKDSATKDKELLSRNLKMKDLSPKDSDSKDSPEMFEPCTPVSDTPVSDADDQFGDSFNPFNGKNASAPDSDTVVKPDASNVERISAQEVGMVLKHYGLQHPEENGKEMAVDRYFGSARLWPWEIIYYRRLKKGSISAENYSRRMAQNEQFGIVDRYVRCSSGWGEVKKDP
ncbi:uncharacterized protein LOC127239729 [Andrographis paniculata]|uniref:uncharacterized protein LOC127239729 n=1 Tax=Andrographis paniculata TaxID=175694 RepID=UPI0021E7571C|nr:uncharacterized protein LOC127239729 [Andrographis paniculata]